MGLWPLVLAALASCALSLFLPPPNDSCRVNLIAPQPYDAISGPGIRVTAHVTLAAPFVGRPLAVCCAVEEHLSNSTSGLCLPVARDPANPGATALIDYKFNLGPEEGREGVFRIHVFVFPGANEAEGRELLKEVMLGTVPAVMPCTAASTFVSFIEHTNPWWSEYLTPPTGFPDQDVILTAVAQRRQDVAAANARLPGFAAHHDPVTGWVNAFTTQPALSYRPLPNLLGPAVVEPLHKPSLLVAVFSGGGTKDVVSRNVMHLHTSLSAAGGELSVMLFVYDDSEWGDVEWAAAAEPPFPVVFVRVRKQMKWWCVSLAPCV
ncbi:MAG: hypothetical protein P4L40_05380 [Terracidiphilus sp.]|nr:hypothetical protein [Terracidiphilus sp.]